MALSPHYQKFLEQLDVLPDTAAVPLPVAALHEGVSVKTIKRNYPRVKLTERREGVLLGFLRRKREQIRLTPRELLAGEIADDQQKQGV
jgi:hypothetical protein